MSRCTGLLFVAMLTTMVNATEPGQPLGCEDWSVIEPNLSVVTYARLSGLISQRVEFDVEGRQLVVGHPGGQPFCEPHGPRGALPVMALDRTGVWHVIACLQSRSGPYTGSLDYAEVDLSGCPNSGPGWSCVRFDPMNGILNFTFTAVGEGYPAGSPYSNYRTQQTCSFQGFATILDVAQTFQTSSSLGFRVPYMPEGLPASDHFDTYYGPLVKPIDFSQARGLQCSYPSSPPSVGEYLEVADSVPTPAPGHGYYYVTAVTHLGQTRYGRKASGGVLSGRDPAGLAACKAAP
jgi:hypothetical protein